MIVGGWAPGRGRLAGLPGALLAGERHEGTWRCVGSVGTGWSDRERTTFAALLRVAAATSARSTRHRVAGARRALPRLVGEVRYATRTRRGSGRGGSGPVSGRRSALTDLRRRAWRPTCAAAGPRGGGDARAAATRPSTPIPVRWAASAWAAPVRSPGEQR
ncbi:hypothetical protein ACFRCI_34370 [Streptomyces sp. NPDC056638]|uniref:ATP dependent DNA ligase n=1 Tax=Streptomyces sp. NPDC056638 TaxID=3345887 RepID=UPI0036BECED6